MLKIKYIFEHISSINLELFYNKNNMYKSIAHAFSFEFNVKDAFFVIGKYKNCYMFIKRIKSYDRPSDNQYYNFMKEIFEDSGNFILSKDLSNFETKDMFKCFELLEEELNKIA